MSTVGNEVGKGRDMSTKGNFNCSLNLAGIWAVSPVELGVCLEQQKKHAMNAMAYITSSSVSLAGSSTGWADFLREAAATGGADILREACGKFLEGVVEGCVSMKLFCRAYIKTARSQKAST